MSTQIISINTLSLSFTGKVCFADFTATIHDSNRIGLIGPNGSGKSCLLKIIAGDLVPDHGSVTVHDDYTVSYVPQIIQGTVGLSGAERFQKRLSQALKTHPDILCLDEPSNHFDAKNRVSLIKMLQRFPGTLLIASHDEELLHLCTNQVWHVRDGKIHIFNGHYEDFQTEQQVQYHALKDKLHSLGIDKKRLHKQRMKEQQRTSKQKKYGQKKYGKDGVGLPAVANQKQGYSERNSGKKAKNLDAKRSQILDELSTTKLPETIKPTFHLQSPLTPRSKNSVQIQNGACGYNHLIVKDINFSISGGQKVHLTGPNGSGKSTVLKAIMGWSVIQKTGTWIAPDKRNIGYLDQHYSDLLDDLTVFETIETLGIFNSSQEIRTHLNDFLFRKSEEISKKVLYLSGGEKARLSLAKIAAQTPDLLILDELTNNLDRETKHHVIEILQAYPGSVLFVSHDEDFATSIGIDETVAIQEIL